MPTFFLDFVWFAKARVIFFIVAGRFDSIQYIQLSLSAVDSAVMIPYCLLLLRRFFTATLACTADDDS